MVLALESKVPEPPFRLTGVVTVPLKVAPNASSPPWAMRQSSYCFFFAAICLGRGLFLMMSARVALI
jgi:hypothetical protein